MPTHFQQHSFTKYSVNKNRRQPKVKERQQGSSKVIAILNGKLQYQHAPSTRKKSRFTGTPASNCWKKHELVAGIKDSTKATYDNLLTELEFSCDCLATINVVYESLRHAYSDGKCDIEQQGNDARLCDMEKELLIAYDDLNLQINHLEKNIIKMEQRLIKLKSMQP
ncbi:hypothetical protein BD408DRAFT_435729 [Parasitella parasitica]|nr:hypothetical protein BD408DRAFT_435729 [Parasitella parasitica]